MNENDELWVELRHEHIAKVIHTLGERVKELSSNAGAKLAKVRARAARSSLKRGRDHLELGYHFVQDSGADLSLTDMADAMKKVTSGEYQEMNAKLSKHLNVTQECMDVFGRAECLPALPKL